MLQLPPVFPQTAATAPRRRPTNSEFKAESHPRYMAPRLHLPHANAVVGDRSYVLGMFGMVPYWADTKLARQTYNARTETVGSKPSLRNAYKLRQLCAITVVSYEPNYETGKAVGREIADAEGGPLGIAGIWEHKQDGPNGLPLLSFSTVIENTDGYPLMQRLDRPMMKSAC